MGIEKKQHLCLTCLECCKNLAIPFDYHKLSEDEIKFYKMRGIEFITTNKSPYMIFNLPCSMLTDKGCSIYKDRPKICREYDGREVPFMKYKCKWCELEG